MADIREALRSYGLSDREITIYLSSLALGTATANAICEKASLNRSTTYDVLKALCEKGLASRVMKEGTACFEVADPRRFLGILDERRSKISSVMAELELMKRMTVTKPRVEFYEGTEGMKTVLQKILDARLPIDVISTSKVFDVITYAFPRYIEERSRLGIRARVIQEKSRQTDELRRKDSKEKRETRSMKGGPEDSMTFIFGEHIVIIKLSKKEPISILIHDSEIAQDHKHIFELLWRNSAS